MWRGIRPQTRRIHLLGHVIVQAQQDHCGRILHVDVVGRVSGYRYYGPGQKSTITRSPAEDQKEDRGQQKHHAANIL